MNNILSGKPSTPEPPTAVTPKEYTITLQEISKGMDNNAVRRVQTLLIARGYDCGGDIIGGIEKPDGDFGTATEKAVREFQKAVGLTVNGVVDAGTMAALLK